MSLGAAIPTFGGAIADAALSMKYQIEMTMAITTIYERHITDTEAQRICLIVAGIGTINEAAKGGWKEITKQVFIKMTTTYLKSATFAAVKGIFKN